MSTDSGIRHCVSPGHSECIVWFRKHWSSLNEALWCKIHRIKSRVVFNADGVMTGLAWKQAATLKSWGVIFKAGTVADFVWVSKNWLKIWKSCREQNRRRTGSALACMCASCEKLVFYGIVLVRKCLRWYTGNMSAWRSMSRISSCSAVISGSRPCSKGSAFMYSLAGPPGIPALRGDIHNRKRAHHAW